MNRTSTIIGAALLITLAYMYLTSTSRVIEPDEVTETLATLRLDDATEPLLLDFTASWCGPCQQIAPILDELATEYAGRVTIKKIDVDAYPELAETFHVSNIPVLFFIRNGKVVDSRSGFQSKESIASVLDWML